MKYHSVSQRCGHLTIIVFLICQCPFQELLDQSGNFAGNQIKLSSTDIPTAGENLLLFVVLLLFPIFRIASRMKNQQNEM